MQLNKCVLPLLVSLADVDPATAGRFTGQAFVLLGLLAGVWKCWAICRRPTTNTKCVLGLMFVLLGFLASSFISILSPMTSVSAVRTLLAVFLGVVFLGCVITAIVLSIIGLTELSSRPGAFVQGKAQAIWALVLAGCFGLIFTSSFFSGLVRSREAAVSKGSGQAGQMLTYEDLNFRFRAPERPWVTFNTSKINKDCKLSFMRRFPEVYFMIIAERFGTTTDFNTEQLAEVGKAHLESAVQSSRVLKETHLKINGLDGRLVETEATLGTQSLYYQHWYLATNGWAYQLIGYGRSPDRLRVSEELRGIFRRFELLDATRFAELGSGAFRTNLVSAHYNYWVNVTNSVWHAYPAIDKDFPEAEFGASRGDSCLVVVPVGLQGEKLELDSLTAGVLGMMAIKFPDEELKNRKDYSPADLEGVQYDYERDVDKTHFRYRLGILKGQYTGYLVAAWTQRRETDTEAILSDAFGRVHFTSPAMALLSAERQVTPRERKTQGFVLNHAALFHYNSGDYERALPLFRAAARANDSETLYAVNALQTWRHLERPREALEFLESQPASLFQLPDVRAWQAYFQAEASLSEQALTNYAAVFAAGFHDDTHFSQYINLLNAQRRYADALAEIETYVKKEDSVSVRLLEAEIYRLQEDYPKAISLLRQQREKAPFNSQVAGALVEASLAASAFTDALELSREMVKRNKDSAYALYLRGKSELGLKWYRDAKVSFEAAARLAPADKTISSYVEHVSGLVGEGNNLAVKDPIEPVAFPPAWTNWPGEPPPVEYAKNYSAYYPRKVVAVSWQPGKEHKTTEFFMVRVLDSSGVAAFSTLQRPFDPLSEQVFVNEVRVMDRSGATVSAGNLADYYVLDDHSQQIASHKKMLNIPVPGLQPGCQLAVTITRRELGKLEDFPFFEQSFSRGFPIQESIVLLRGDGAGLKYRASPPFDPEKLPEGLCWRCADPLVVRYEPLQPPVPVYAPMLWIADGAARWPALVTNYLASIKDRFETDPAIAEQARKVAGTLEKTEQKIAALAAYVQTNYTYKAIEFGRRARIPNKPADVLRNKYGDCKDHAVLLQQLLVATGVPARLALVSHRDPVQQDLPSLDQFDHMIVYVPGQKSAFIDCTDKGADLTCGIPAGLAGRDVLVLESENPRFESIPCHGEDASIIDVQRRVKLSEFSDIAAEETLKLSGVHAAYLRNFLQEIPPTSRRMIFQQQMGLADVEITEFKSEPLESPGSPLEVRYSYTFKKQFHRSNDRLAGVLRAGVERTYLAAAPVDLRLAPFEIQVPLRLRSTVIIDVPDGFSVETPAGLKPQLDARFATCTNQCRVAGTQLKIDFECRQPAGKFKAADYAPFRETMAHALSPLEREVVFTPTKAEAR